MLAHNLGAVRHWGDERDEHIYTRRYEDIDEILALFRDDPWVADLEPLTRYAYSSYGYSLRLRRSRERHSRRSCDGLRHREHNQGLHGSGAAEACRGRADRPGLRATDSEAPAGGLSWWTQAPSIVTRRRHGTRRGEATRDTAGKVGGGPYWTGPERGSCAHVAGGFSAPRITRPSCYGLPPGPES
jgi:hypothetical protein